MKYKLDLIYFKMRALIIALILLFDFTELKYEKN
tara:strand:+ start:228 stop:329 length:102 start_codon:yes stop_codon:yes gene_type:complete